jgi:hypothetical protein
MSDLDYAMQKYMTYIVLSEQRPFSYGDFLHFEFDGIEYKMTHGTFRNKICKLIQDGVLELSYYSTCAFYTLKGHKFGKPMTPNRMVVHDDPFYRTLRDLPFDKQSIHDIRLRFKVPGIWKVLSINPDFHVNERSKDIAIPSWIKDHIIVRIMIHRTDTVSVIIGCSVWPIQLDANGIIRFFNLLVRVEEKLQTVLDNSPINSNESENIPDYKSWIVTMWHFGRDSLVEYTNEKCCISIGSAQHMLTRLYVKDFNGKNRVRIEKQEYPKKTVLDAIEEKLNVTN